MLKLLLLLLLYSLLSCSQPVQSSSTDEEVDLLDSTKTFYYSELGSICGRFDIASINYVKATSSYVGMYSICGNNIEHTNKLKELVGINDWLSSLVLPSEVIDSINSDLSLYHASFRVLGNSKYLYIELSNDNYGISTVTSID